MGRAERLERRARRIQGVGVLGEVADPDRWASPDFPAAGWKCADERLGQHALSRAVLAQDAQPLAGKHGERGPEQDWRLAEHDVDVAQLDDLPPAPLVGA